MYTTFLPCMFACQNRAPDLIIDDCEPPCGGWELNSGPLEEQPVLLTSEPSLQPPKLSCYLEKKRGNIAESLHCVMCHCDWFNKELSGQ